MSKSSAIMTFGNLLMKSKNLSAVGEGGPIFSLAAPGDIAILGEAPKDFNGRTCRVQVPDEERPLLCRLYKKGNKVRIGYMDDYDVWKEYPADAVTVLHEILAVAHLYGKAKEEAPKARTAWEKRVSKAMKEAIGKFTYKDYEQLMQHHQGGRTYALRLRTITGGISSMILPLFDELGHLRVAAPALVDFIQEIHHIALAVIRRCGID